MKFLSITDLPRGISSTPELDLRRDDIVRRFEIEKLNPNIRIRLALIAEMFQVFGEQAAYEAALKTKALGVIMRDRLKNKQRLLNG